MKDAHAYEARAAKFVGKRRPEQVVGAICGDEQVLRRCKFCAMVIVDRGEEFTQWQQPLARWRHRRSAHADVSRGDWIRANHDKAMLSAASQKGGGGAAKHKVRSVRIIADMMYSKLGDHDLRFWATPSVRVQNWARGKCRMLDSYGSFKTQPCGPPSKAGFTRRCRRLQEVVDGPDAERAARARKDLLFIKGESLQKFEEFTNVGGGQKSVVSSGRVSTRATGTRVWNARAVP